MVPPVEPVDAAMVVDLRLGPQSLDQLDALPEPPDAVLRWDLELAVVLHATQPHAEDRAAVADVVQRGHAMRDLDRAVDGQDDHRHAHADARGDRGGVRQDRQRVKAEDVVDRVLGDPEVLEPERVGPLRDPAHCCHVDRVGRAMGQRDTEGDLHLSLLIAPSP
jgi:hypothetical protein